MTSEVACTCRGCGKEFEAEPQYRHRVLCGDSTKREEMGTLVNGERPDMLLTDPPYGVSHGSGVTEAKAIRGDLGQAVVPVGFAVSLELLSDDARLYVFGGSGQFAMYLTLWDHYLHSLPRVIVWVKEAFVLRQLGYHSQFELIYWGWKGSGGGVGALVRRPFLVRRMADRPGPRRSAPHAEAGRSARDSVAQFATTRWSRPRSVRRVGVDSHRCRAGKSSVVLSRAGRRTLRRDSGSLAGSNRQAAGSRRDRGSP